MNTLNLFKSIKNISYVTAFACLPLSSACGEHTPQQIIEAYAKDTDRCFESGNVLAYKNIEGKTVVLKSGSYFNLYKEPIEKDVIVVSLEEVLKHTGGNIYNFGNSAIKDNSNWYNYIKSEFPFKRDKVVDCEKITPSPMETPPTKQLKLTIEGESDKKLIMTFLCNVNEKIECDYDRKTQEVSWEPLRYIDTLKSEEEFESDGRLKSKSSDLHSRLDKFRHTEIQVQALLKKYKDIEVKDKKSLKKLQKNYPHLYRTYEEEQKTKDLIKTRLPVALTDPSNTEIDHNIYSLFEACHACRQTEWLQSKKDIFMFKVADGQVIKRTIINKKTGKEENVRYRKSTDFMSQEDLETKIERFPKEDIGIQLTSNGFEEITQPKKVSSANSTSWEW